MWQEELKKVNVAFSFAQSVAKEIKNPVVKSFNSFKGIGKYFKNGLDTRKDKALNSPYDFANYLTLGAVDGIWSGAKSRKDKMFNSPSDFLNYATSGLTDMVKGSVNPKDPLSKEHWLDSFGVATSVLGVGVSSTKPTGGSSYKPSNTIPNNNLQTVKIMEIDFRQSKLTLSKTNILLIK